MSSAPTSRRTKSGAVIGFSAAVVLVILAVALPRLLHWAVNAETFPPLHADWRPRVGAGTIPALAIAISAVVFAPRLAQSLRWRWLLLVSFVAGLGWMLSLAFVDGVAGISGILVKPHEYLNTARAVTNVFTTLHEFISRIPLQSPHHWQVQVTAHPPGALLFFVLLVQLGLGSGLAAGLVVTILAATIPVAVLLTLRRLGTEVGARAAVPFLAFAPAAIWEAVSGDAMFAAVAAWGLCALAFAATARRWRRIIPWSALAGLLLGYCLFLSYGLVLLAVIALAILIIARSWRPLPGALVVVAAITAVFALTGFEWWRAYPVLSQRYYDGIASVRPYDYWIWANLAALTVSAGPVIGAVVVLVVARIRRLRSESASVGPVVILTLAALAMVVLADVSGMSKAEVERIWLPFIPWLLVGTALVPARWVRIGLAIQVVVALLVQHLLHINW